jgi:sulfur-carrier protein adenylyltransferase/sulfurtransferase
VVDEVKRRVPIWKKEYYSSGPTAWLNVQGKQVVTRESFYDRQVRVPEVGASGQDKLNEARVLVVGAGGLGSPALLYLAGAGIGRITVVDPDRVDVSNLHRQPLYRASDAGYPKARLAAEKARLLNPMIDVRHLQARLTPGNADDLVGDHDVVLDCTDNFGTKFLLNEACVRLGRQLVIASIHQFDGQLLVVRTGGACLRCLWPTPPTDGCVGTCAEVGVLGVVPGVFGTLQASEAIKLVLGMPPQEELAILDIKTLSLDKIRLPKDPSCPVCGVGEEPFAEPFVVYGLDDRDILVDIREPHETVQDQLPNALQMPMSNFDPDDSRLASAERVVLVCAKGVRSRYLAEMLQRYGYAKFFSWVGGRGDFR